MDIRRGEGEKRMAKRNGVGGENAPHQNLVSLGFTDTLNV